MTITEMKNRMEEIARKRFYLACKDHWDREDYKQDTKWFQEWLKLRNTLKEIGEKI